MQPLSKKKKKSPLSGTLRIGSDEDWGPIGDCLFLFFFFSTFLCAFFP